MTYLLLVSNILILIVFLLKLNRLPPQIPLFYSRSWGEEQLADWWMILFLPFMINFFFFFNRYIQKKFFSDNQLVIRIINYLNLFLIITLTLIFIKIIFLIT